MSAHLVEEKAISWAWRLPRLRNRKNGEIAEWRRLATRRNFADLYPPQDFATPKLFYAQNKTNTLLSVDSAVCCTRIETNLLFFPHAALVASVDVGVQT
jgi:hypothetical protein